MRNIEGKIRDAFFNGLNTQHLSDRDAVFHCGNESTYKLWGNRIIWKDSEGLHFNMCGYDTMTTRSRINAFLGLYDFQVKRDKGILYLYKKGARVRQIGVNETVDIIG